MKNLLISFQRSLPEPSIDWKERLGAGCLVLFNGALGRQVQVVNIDEELQLVEKPVSLLQRIVCAALAIFLHATIPWTLSLIPIGFALTYYSDSHHQLRGHKPRPPQPVSSPVNGSSADVSTEPEIPINSYKGRRIPPVGAFETCIFDDSGRAHSKYGATHIFTEVEILKVHEVTKQVLLKQGGKEQSLRNFGNVEPAYALHTATGGAVIPQYGTRGCTSACANMLIYDQGSQPDVFDLHTRDLGTSESMAVSITQAGLKPLETEVDDFSQLGGALKVNGVASVGIGAPEFGGHQVVVDQVGETTVTISEPYHGWKVDISQLTFLKYRSFPLTVLQASKVG